MTAQAASTTTTASLRRNVLGLPQVVFQGITHIAPSINVVFAFPVIALKAGPTMPISFLLTTIVCLFIANTVSQFSRYMPSSGGYYSFATRGLGARGGFMTTWSYLIYDIIGPAGAIGFLGYLCSSTIQMATGTDVPWWIFALATFAIVWALTHYGIKLSMRTTAIFGGIEIADHARAGADIPGPSGPRLVLHRAAEPGQLAAPLGRHRGRHGVLGARTERLRGARRHWPRRPSGPASSSAARSCSRCCSSASSTSSPPTPARSAGAPANMAAFASNANPYYALGHSLWGAGWWFIFIALINSAIGCGLACTNAASRVSYTMGQAGTLPPRFGKIHPVHQTPTFAIAVQQSIGIVAILLVGLLLAPGDIFGFLGTMATLAVIVLYVMANFALTAYIRREHRDDYSVWKHLVVPAHRHARPAAGAVDHRVPVPRLAHQHRAVPVHRGAAGRRRVHDLAGAAPARRAAARRDRTGRPAPATARATWNGTSSATGASASSQTRANGVELGPVELPAYDLPADSRPSRWRPIRLAWPRRRLRRGPRAWTRCIVYADREHFANLSYLTGYDPRFEESLLILLPGRPPVLLVGNEGEAYAAVVPDGSRWCCYQSFSLVEPGPIGQPAAGPGAEGGRPRRRPAADRRRGLEVFRAR